MGHNRSELQLSEEEEEEDGEEEGSGIKKTGNKERKREQQHASGWRRTVVQIPMEARPPIAEGTARPSSTGTATDTTEESQQAVSHSLQMKIGRLHSEVTVWQCKGSICLRAGLRRRAADHMRQG